MRESINVLIMLERISHNIYRKYGEILKKYMIFEPLYTYKYKGQTRYAQEYKI